MNDLNYIQELGLIQSRFPNLNWSLNNEEITAELNVRDEQTEGVIPTDFLVCIARVYDTSLYRLSIYINSKRWLVTYRSEGRIKKVLDDFEAWMKNIYVAFTPQTSSLISKKEELILLIEKAVEALNAVAENKYYRNLKSLNFYTPDMLPEDGIIGCEQLIEYLCEEYESPV